MDKDNSLPPSGRFPTLSPAGNAFNMSSEASASNLTSIGPGGTMDSGRIGHGMSSDSGRFSHDISQMSDNPTKHLGHRRAHSEIFTLPDDINFDSDLGVVGVSDGPSFSDDAEEDLLSMYLDMEKFNSSSATSSFAAGGPTNTTLAAPATGTNPAHNGVGMSGERPRARHQHSHSMDGSSVIKSEMLMSESEEASAIVGSKKSISATNLQELALIDPKRAKRIWANRQSAARSKERKMRYIAELERKLQALQTDATSMTAQLSILQRDTMGLTAENSELKLRLQTVEQQVHLQDALNDTLKEEIQHLKVLTGQTMPNGGPMMNYSAYGGNHSHYASNQSSMHNMMAAKQFQQLQIHPQKPQQHPFQQHQLLHQQQQLHQQLNQQQKTGDFKPIPKDNAPEPDQAPNE